jgi:sulfite exporter TauE/SafE
MNKITISFFILGLSFGAGPCIASCGPLLISYIAGTGKGIFKSLMVYILFSLARIFAYLAISLLVFFLGRFVIEKFISSSSKYILVAGGAFFVLIGALMALGKRTNFKLCAFLEKHMLTCDKKSIITFGLIIGLLPCAPLLAIFSYIVLISKSYFETLLYSFSFGMGTFVSPLIFLALASGLIPKYFIGKRYERIFSLICGLVIIFLGFKLTTQAFF